MAARRIRQNNINSVPLLIGWQQLIIFFWLPVIICAGLIFYSSSLACAEIPFLFRFQDIFFHLLAYGTLAYFFSRALKRSLSEAKLASVIIFSVLFGLSYGVSDEWHQLFVPGRSVSGLDIFLDGAGSFLGSLLYSGIKI